jgi:hypothetical protein
MIPPKYNLEGDIGLDCYEPLPNYTVIILFTKNIKRNIIEFEKNMICINEWKISIKI